ncbi:12718_t:CDS:2 [Funneliformis mosseae]|uniref:12718_t:CDS:1 n=1 Tax=Funneliformis mosseae TaxID=27381 RepID=A0A9N9H6U9_FUNMO|nr:12718_t:CDS:2 [Funneliformis mosseae]
MLTIDSNTKLNNEYYDFIIVGAGTAGCVLARELFYNIPNINILVLEAGPPDTHINDIMRLPCAYSMVRHTSETDWGYSTEDQRMPSTVDPTEEVLNKGFPYPRGKVIGGCSTVNAMAYMRGHKADYDLWAAQDPEYIIWNYDHCLEAFKAVENNARKDPDVEFENYHGFNGLLYVQDPAVDELDISKDVFKVVRKFGIPYNKDFNGAKQNGVGRYQFTMKDGKRFTLADGYLKDALKNVTVYPPKPFIEGHPHAPGDDNVGKFVAVNVKSFAHMLNIIWDEKKKDENVAIGVRYSYNGKVHNCYIAPKGEVIICGGAINSPQILMLSGIGPKKNLENNSIKVRKELPVGHNLWDHPFCIVTASVSVPNSTSASIFNYSSYGVDFVSFYKGNIEGKIPSREELNDERPDIQQISGAVLFDKGIIAEHPTDKKEFYSMLTALNIPSSVGHLELRSSDPFAHPKIFVNYYDKPEDLYRMMSSLKLSRKILEQPPLSTYWGVKVIGLDEVNDDKEWENYIRKRTISSAHPCGTVKMAPESKGGCVNHRLQVYGTKNLRVVDASIFPTIPAGNLNAPTAMVAWRASKLIKEDYYKKV